MVSFVNVYIRQNADFYSKERSMCKMVYDGYQAVDTVRISIFLDDFLISRLSTGLFREPQASLEQKRCFRVRNQCLIAINSDHAKPGD